MGENHNLRNVSLKLIKTIPLFINTADINKVHDKKAWRE